MFRGIVPHTGDGGPLGAWRIRLGLFKELRLDNDMTIYNTLIRTVPRLSSRPLLLLHCNS